MIDQVSMTQRISWAEATNLNVYEFLNTLCYRIDTDRHKLNIEKAQMEAAKAKIKRY